MKVEEAMWKNVPILLVEDDLVDVKTVRRAFLENRLTNPLYDCSNGAQALAFLRNEGDYGDVVDAPRPGIILLDLNMPVMNGIEFLREVKADDGLKSIPVVVLTSSQEGRDRAQSYGQGAAGYIVKPIEFIEFLDIIKTFDLYWTMCELP
ncbi:MAG: response regulator [Pirellulaceae bacterium]